MPARLVTDVCISPLPRAEVQFSAIWGQRGGVSGRGGLSWGSQGHKGKGADRRLALVPSAPRVLGMGYLISPSPLPQSTRDSCPHFPRKEVKAQKS